LGDRSVRGRVRSKITAPSVTSAIITLIKVTSRQFIYAPRINTKLAK
jgi:hypothetical protein